MNFLIVIDMQYDFIEGVLGTPQAQDIVLEVVDIIEKFDNRFKHNKDGVILYTKDTHEEYNLTTDDIIEYSSTQEGKMGIPEHCIWQTWGWHIESEVEHTLEECECKVQEIKKSTFGSFELIHEIRRNVLCISDINEIILIGLCTDICVISNALLLKAAYSEAKISVLKDACAGSTPKRHKQALKVMRSNQIYVI